MSKPRGFAALPEKRRKEIAAMGGKAAHEADTAYKFTPEKAREAGRKGGQASKRKRRGEPS